MLTESAHLHRRNLFEARTRGYRTYRIPGILCTPRGALLATVEARRGRGGDWDDNDVVIRRSVDGGDSWDEQQVLVTSGAYGPGPISNFVMIADREESCVHALFCHDYARVFTMRSDDDGLSFTSPQEITERLAGFRAGYPWRVIATGPGHGIQLRSGRLLVPIWMSDGTGTEFGPGKLGHRPSAVATIYSDDHGATWQRGAIVVRHGSRVTNPSETMAVELANGRVLLNIRNESPQQRRLIVVGPDGAGGWEKPAFDAALLEPICMASLIRAGEGGPVLFANPDTLERTMGQTGRARDRKRLAVKASYDDCRTWPVSRVLEEGPAGYSDLAVLPDGTICCLYECGIVERMNDDRYVTLARLNLAWLHEKADHMPGTTT